MSRDKVGYWMRWYHGMSPERKKAHNQKRYDKYPAQYKNWRDKWAANNPHKAQASTHNAQLRKRYPKVWVLTTITNASLAEWILENKGTPCVYCGEPATHIDHKTPLAKGGLHEWVNLQMCCEFCNLSKRNLSEEEFLQKIRLIYELKISPVV